MIIGAGYVLCVSTSSHKPNTMWKIHIPIYGFLKSLPRVLDYGMEWGLPGTLTGEAF